jgi:CRP/FNR family transcriptional regulator
MATKVFQRIPIFKDLTADQLVLLEQLFVIEECAEGDVIFEQGSTAEYLYILVAGEVAIEFNPDDDSPIMVARIQEGGVFGWSAAFGSGTYTSGAVCLAESRLLKVLGEDLKTLRQNHPKTGILILERLAAVVAERLKCSKTHGQVLAMLEHGLKNGIKPIGG